MSNENENIVRKGVRWLRVGLLTYTLASPFISAFLERIRRRAQTVKEQVPTPQEAASLAQTAQIAARNRLDELIGETRQVVNAQAQQLRQQARQLQATTRQLRKVTRQQARERRKYYQQLRKTSSDWRQGLAERSSKATQDVVGATQGLLERSGKVSQVLMERGGKATQALAERGNKAAQDLTQRGSQVTQNVVGRGSKASKQLASRGKQLTQELAERSDQLLAPLRKEQSESTATRRNAWTIVGFTFGIVAAAVVTYFFVRQRMARQALDNLEEQIELPQSDNWNGVSSDAGRNTSLGEIHRLDDAAVATLPVVEVEYTSRPEDATHVGVASTKLYYLIEVPLEADDLVYFNSEEEAKEQGFTAAAIE